jgi:hypothetical protein
VTPEKKGAGKIEEIRVEDNNLIRIGELKSAGL